MKDRVKSFEEIKQTIDELGMTKRGIPFPYSVRRKCGQEVDVMKGSYFYQERDPLGVMFDPDWLEFPNGIGEVEDFKNDPDTITITVRADDREFAHRCLDSAIDEYEKRYDWTPMDICKARTICTILLKQAFQKNLCPVFYNLEDRNEGSFVRCDLNYGTFGVDKIAYAFPKGKDKFNWDIGRCVALCKAMGEPVPDFIKNKNKN